MDIITREAWSFKHGLLKDLFINSNVEKELLPSPSHPGYFGKIGKLVCCTKNNIDNIYDNIPNISCITNSCDTGVYLNNGEIHLKGHNTTHIQKIFKNISPNIQNGFLQI